MGQIVKGVSWSAIERFSVQIVQFVISIFLARLLMPEAYGIVALALVIMNIMQTINEMGFGEALMHKLDRDELDFSSVFIMNIFLGCSLYAILYFTSPLIERLFAVEGLTKVIRWIGLNLIITSLVVVQRTKLFISIDFKSMAKASLIGAIVSGLVGIIYAYRGGGVMALVAQSLLNNLISMLIIWMQAKWRPHLKFSATRFKELFSYAYTLILARFINTLFTEIYSVAVGAFYTPTQLGLFNRAKSFEVMSTNNITQIVQRVSTPVLCEKQKDFLDLGNSLLSFIRHTAFIVFPMLCGLFVLAEPLIKVLLTDKWVEAVWILQTLCPVGFCYVLSTFNMNIFNTTGRTDWALKSEVIKKIVDIAIIAISITISFEALVLAQVVVAIFEMFVNLIFTRKQINLGIMAQFKSVAGVFFCSLVMAICIAFVVSIIKTDYLKLIVGIVVGVFSYTLLSFIFNVNGIRRIIARHKNI
ncbi:MAG: lipopolysaccharide biosynthesis protein [Bacteroidales bacterium]|nr:lipopolysaccharide biosynthesis protein [Bacteroidales bacterium]